MNQVTPKSVLEQISTCWPMISNPVQFVMRYARAIQKYVAAIVRDPHDAEEVAQDFLVRVFDKSFCPENVSRGRFRDYLKSAVRYVAISHLRKRRAVELSEEMLASIIQPDSDADLAWTHEWQSCVLERAWQSLELYQQQTKDNGFYSVLRLHTDHPQKSSEELATQFAEQLGRPLRADAFRQQLRRARKHFAKLIVAEVRQTLQNPTAQTVEKELVDLLLMPYVREFLTVAD
ncbi:MAG: sigma-70 family RNA polymerase sigma factor [Planctomycetia bacterium]|nr:sigma-70 family RNA polymerase sigma factor [Planctomycetia bacterium]